jgi:hypothetical protein
MDSRLAERFWPKVDKSGDCWLWTATTSADGYGRINISGKMVYVHRIAYEEFVGPIPDGLCLDHLCRQRNCLNPEHLEAVPMRVNLMRGDGHTARNAAKEVCDNGHPYTPENTYIHPASGWRQCRECRKAYDRKRSRQR